MKTTFQIAWKTMKEKRQRALLLVASTAVASFFLFTSYFFLISLNASIGATDGRLGADIIVVPKGMGSYVGDNLISGTVSPLYFDERDIWEKLSTIKEIEKVTPQLFLHTISTTCCGTEGDFPIVAFDPGTDFTLQSFMPGVQHLEKDEVVIGVNAGGDRFIYHYGDEVIKERVMLFFEPFHIKNVLFPTGTGADQTIFMRLDTARKLTQKVDALSHISATDLSAIFINTAPHTALLIKQQLEHELDGVDVVLGGSLKEGIKKQIAPLKLLSYTMIFVALVLTVIQVATLFSAIIQERQKEIGMLYALGVRKWQVYQLLLSEAMIVAFIGSVVGVLVSLSILYDRQTLLYMLFQLPLVVPNVTTTLLMSGVTIVIITCFTIVAAFFPIRAFFSKQPYEVLREGDS